MSQDVTNVEYAVALGRIEQKQDSLKDEFRNHSTSNVSFQATMQDAVKLHESQLAKHETRLDGHDIELKDIKDNAKSMFTKSTVIIGLILTVVNVLIGVLK